MSDRPRGCFIQSTQRQGWVTSPFRLPIDWDMFPNYQETQGYHEHIQAMQARTPRHAEFFLPNLKTWVEVNIYPSMDGGLAIYFRDITERKRAEESLCESEQKFRTVIETAGESIGIASPNGPFYYVN